MSRRKMAAALSLIVVASPVLAQPSEQHSLAGAPSAGPDARYCMRVEAVTGTRVERVRCWTREQWVRQGIDVDKEWAKEGVSVIE